MIKPQRVLGIQGSRGNAISECRVRNAELKIRNLQSKFSKTPDPLNPLSYPIALMALSTVFPSRDTSP